MSGLKGERISELEHKVGVLESTVERLDADRKTLVRHAQTTARNVRRLIAENREFRRQVTTSLAAKAIRDHIAEPLRPVHDPLIAITTPTNAVERAFK